MDRRAAATAIALALSAMALAAPSGANIHQGATLAQDPGRPGDGLHRRRGGRGDDPRSQRRSATPLLDGPPGGTRPVLL